VSSIALHLMTQRNQPYGSERRCCEACGVMLVARPDSFWLKHAWTDSPQDFGQRHATPGGTGTLVPCNQPQDDA
jgi:hypothetical protein